MFGAAQYEVADGIEVYAKGMFTRSKVQLSLASSGMFGDTWQLPLNNPFLPEAVRSEVCASNAISAADCAAAGAATSPNDPAYREVAAVINRRFIEAGRSEEHTSELQSLMRSSYAVFCLTKKQ